MKCSDAGLNQLASNIVWTQRGNLHSIPTDCPQRDERAGWMGDAQVFSQTAIYNMDMAAFFTKWIRDIRDSQTPDGRFPDFAPQPGNWMSFYNSPGWGDAGVVVPWRLYENYGDTTVLGVQFEAMKKYIDLIHAENPTLVWRNVVGNLYGDWLNGDNIIGRDYPKTGGGVPNDVYATAFFAYSTRLVANTAHLLGKNADAERYDSLAGAIRKTFQKEFVNPQGEVKGNTQAGYALALEFDLIPEHLRPASAALMVKAIEAYDYRISTGIQSTIRMMNQLSQNGYADVAYRLLQSRRFPSWLYSVDQGATTIWERWDGYVKGRGFQDKGMNSFNHYAIGAVGEWMYRNILGIQPDPASPGYKHFFIAPRPGGGLTYAKGMYHSIAGTIAVRWEKTDSKLFLDVDIPVNTTATVILPKGMVQEGGKPVKSVKGIALLKEDEKTLHYTVPSGHYTFSVMH
jgi:alpha-L-rhamnosidase